MRIYIYGIKFVELILVWKCDGEYCVQNNNRRCNKIDSCICNFLVFIVHITSDDCHIIKYSMQVNNILVNIYTKKKKKCKKLFFC